MTRLTNRNTAQIAWLALLVFLASGLGALVPTAAGQSRGFTILPVPNVGQGPAIVTVNPSGNAYIVAQMPVNSSESMFLVDKFDPSSGAEVPPFPFFNLPVINVSGSQITATGIAVDPQDNIYVTGITDDPNLATPGAQGFVPGSLFGFPNPFNAFAVKIIGAGPMAGTIDYFTYLGSAFVYQVDGFQQLRPAIAVDRAGNAYVTGTAVPGFPGAVVAPFGGGNSDAFVAKINGAGATPGTISYFTYLGGSNDDAGASIAVDDAGFAYVTGQTQSPDFPVLPPTVVQPTPGGGFVTKLNPSGGLTYSTYLSAPGPGYAIAVDAGGNAYIAGRFGVVSKLSADASQLVYSTFLPGLDIFYFPIPTIGCCPDFNSSIAVNAAGEAWVTALYEDGFSFFTKLNAAGSLFVYGSADPSPPGFPAFTNGEEHDGIAVDPSGNAYVIGAIPRRGLFGSPQQTFLLQILDGNTPAGTTPPSVVIHPMDTTTGLSPVTLTFLGSVTKAGTTTLTTSTVGPTPPAGFQLGIPPTYYDLATTALFNGNVKICIHSSGLTAASQLFHNESGIWVDVTMPPVDTVNQIICGSVTSLSPFAILQPTAATLAGNITAKAGPQNARVWTLSLLDNGPGAADGTAINSFTLVQTSGAACTPVISTAFPLAVGNLAPAQAGVVKVTLDFTGCSASARFTARFTYSANGGAASGFVVRYNQFE
jgi:hypothetical protein